MKKIIKEEQYNTQFGVLLFIATLLVIFGHTGISLGSFEWLFHYDSFHMPLFVFISGYFFNTNVSLKNFFKFLKKKINKLIIPFFVFNLIYGLLAVYLYHKLEITWCNGDNFLYNMFIVPFTSGYGFFGFNSPAWFILMLFWVEIISYISYLIFNRLKHEDKIIWIIDFLIAILAVHISKNFVKTDFIIFLTRTLYMIFWFSTGIIYKKYLEKHDNLNSIWYFLIIFLIQFSILILCDGKEMNAFIFNSTFTNNGLLTIMVGGTGVALYLRISRILDDSLGRSSVVKYISKNSFNIMMHQTFGFFVLNVLFLILSNLFSIPGFDYNSFQTNQFYRFYPFGHPAFSLLYCMFGLGIPLLLVFIGNKLKNIAFN